MRKAFLALALVAAGQAAHAQFFGVIQATETTQILNNIQLGLQYAKQVEQFGNQLKQWDREIANIKQLPASLIDPSAYDLIQKIGGAWQQGQAIGGTLSRIDSQFASKYKDLVGNTALTFAEKFKLWTQGSQDSLQASMRSAGMRRDQFASDTDALKALYGRSQQTNGNLEALQTISQINVKMIQQMQALSDLLTAQNLAMSDAMAAQGAQAQAAMDNDDLIKKGTKASESSGSLQYNSQPYKTLDFYKTK